jgi:hypothetical protein
VKVTTAWLIGAGLKIGMRPADIMILTPGEMLDYVTCLAIANGTREKNAYTFDEIMEMH